jgi:hypothetical protein
MTEETLQHALEVKKDIKSTEYAYSEILKAKQIKFYDGHNETGLFGKELEDIRKSLLIGLAERLKTLNEDFKKI